MTAPIAARASLGRNVLVLALAQALSNSVQSAAIATTPLASYAMLGVDKTFATLPLFVVQLGIMATTIPASLLMGRIGRRGGFTVGAMIGIISGLVSTVAIYQQSLPLLCLGTFLQGSSTSFAWYFRFAAADAADPTRRAKAISLVMAGGVLAGFIGPQVAKWAVDWLSPHIFAGVYLATSMLAAGVLVLVQGVRIPTLTDTERADSGRPLAEIMRQPSYVVALLSSMFGYGVMTLVMSATPLAMLACGYKFGDSATVIQGHVVGMFLPSFFTGHLIQRAGVQPVIAAGALIQVGCAMINLAGIDFWNFFLANVLVGLGWNFTFVGGTTLLTTTYRPAERAKVQASHDFLVYATTASAAGLSGILQATAGWRIINLAALPMMGIVVAGAAWHLMRQRRPTVPAE